MKIVKTPDENVAKNPVLIISEATTKIKSEIADGIMKGKTKEEIYDIVSKIIAKYSSQVPSELQTAVKRSLSQMTMRDYTLMSTNIKTFARNAENNLPGYQITTPNDLFNFEDVRFRNLSIDRKDGQAVISNYQKQVREQIKIMSANQPIFTSVRSGKPYKMSMRNLAEMTIRYEANLEDIQKLQEDGEDLVWTSSHVDCSKRCEPYQGKLWSISGKHAGETIEGFEVGKLNDALLGPNKDGNGIINGYNCRHYLIPYRPGSKPPTDYNAKDVAKQRNITTRQRSYENRIRQLKTQQRIAASTGDTELAKRLSERWHKLDNEYRAFSLRNDRAFYPWRTQVGRDETIGPNKETLKNVEQEKANIKADEMEKKYFTEEDGIIKCNFESKDDIEFYMKVKKINFYKTKIDETDIDVLNSKIACVKNLERKCSDTIAPEIIADKLGLDKNAKFVFIKPTYKRQGTFNHIADDNHQEMGNDPKRLKSLSEDIKVPKDLRIWSKKDNDKRFIISYKLDEEHITQIVADKNNNNLDVITAFTPSNKATLKLDKKYCRIL